MRTNARLLVTFSLCCLLTISAAAHSGGTDSKGGHIDHSTGEYHYHHGKPAHQHKNGVCPYSNKTTKQSASKNEDTGASVAIGAGMVAAAAGFYIWRKK